MIAINFEEILRKKSVIAFSEKIKNAKNETQKVQIATAFWKRLGDQKAETVALDDVALSQILKQNPANICIQHATETENFTVEQITDAALYAAR